jgi:putative phosphoribosyl transferase
MKPLRDREAAGQMLARKLKDADWKKASILALPRGGVPIAWEIAKELKLPLDVLLVKKVGAPDQPEFAIGAVSEDEHPIWNQESISFLGIEKRKLHDLAENARKKILEQTGKWRKGRAPLEVKGKTIILVDDGLATGMTMHAAVEFLKRREVKKIVIAAPVASRSAVDSFKNKVDQIVVLQIPEPFFSVGQWYEDFTQVTDEVVTSILAGEIQAEESFKAVKIPVQKFNLSGDLSVPRDPKGVVIFAHGSGSSHKSPRNQFVAKALNQLGFATLLFDLLTDKEAEDRSNVFNIPLLSERLQIATQWIRKNATLESLSIGYFGASTGAAAALVAASKERSISSVVSRGGRPDLAEEALGQVQCPTLLIVGGSDFAVIELNQQTKKYLRHAELVIVPGATHLFDEPGTLDEVVEYAGDWFLNTLAKECVDLTAKPHEAVVQKISSLAHSIISEESYLPLLRKISQARVVMLGEATHGTEEFYQIRKIISQNLIEDYGFNFVAVEGDWPDCYRLNEYVQLRGGKSAEDVMHEFKRWPTWMWANEQVADLVEWMKGRGAGFYGLDVYSLYESLDRVRTYAKKLDPELEKRVLESYSCFDFFNRNEKEYAKSLMKWPAGCEKEIIRILRDILRLRLEETHLHEHELFDVQQNAKIVRNAEKYYRAMMVGGAESWNIRDEHMMDSLDALLRYHGEGAKAIVWAHNTHIGDYHATDMVNEGYVNLGGLARERYGMDNVVLMGFGTYQGEVLAGRAWEAKPEIMKLPPALNSSYEDYFHKASEQIKAPQFYVVMNGDDSLSLRKGHRAVGVVYQPVFESHGRNYVPTELSHRYDAFVFVDRTSSLRALPVVYEKGLLPETWPTGR